MEEPKNSPKDMNDPMPISQCCGAPSYHWDIEDIQICPECKDHCAIEYIEASELSS